MRTKETTVGGLQYPQTSMGLMKNIESTMYIAPGRMKFQNKIEYTASLNLLKFTWSLEK